ncbi:hypothetical protein N7445_010357 [Penicillium cf. griseofulvum]|nr:hypothetical protein N7445_010357 [Penicillium cf. griseofulvum]
MGESSKPLSYNVYTLHTGSKFTFNRLRSALFVEEGVTEQGDTINSHHSFQINETMSGYRREFRTVTYSTTESSFKGTHLGFIGTMPVE